MNIGALQGRCRVIAIKENFNICPWADAVYGCDAHWWKYRRGLTDFKGIRVCWEGNRLGNEYAGIHKVRIEPGHRNDYSDKLELGKPGVIGGGGNSGFQALNLAIQWGSARILLVGFDMNGESGFHWYGRNNWQMANNPTETNFRDWIAAFDKAAPMIKDLGVEVFNASPYSALKCFPRLSIEQFLGDA